MDSDQKKDSLTRRAAIVLTAGATQLWGQKDGKSMGRPVVHFEIGCRDKAKSGDYYSKLFGWTVDGSAPMSSDIDTGGAKGIPGHFTSLGHEPEHFVTFYVDVEDVQASLDKAVALGGKKVVGPVPFPGGTFAWFTDPDGNLIGLLKPKKA
jgi:uncharacterized protein